MEIFSTVTKQSCVEYMIKGRNATKVALIRSGLSLDVLEIIDGMINYMQTMPESFVNIHTGEIINEQI